MTNQYEVTKIGHNPNATHTNNYNTIGEAREGYCGVWGGNPEPLKLEPEIGKAIVVQGKSMGDCWHTSRVIDFHCHGDKHHPIWLNPDLNRAADLKDGDILVETMNSFYRFRPIIN